MLAAMCALSSRAKDGRRKAEVHAGDTATRAAAVAAREQATSTADAQILDQAADEAQHLFIGEAAHKARVLLNGRRHGGKGKGDAKRLQAAPRRAHLAES